MGYKHTKANFVNDGNKSHPISPISAASDTSDTPAVSGASEGKCIRLISVHYRKMFIQLPIANVRSMALVNFVKFYI